LEIILNELDGLIASLKSLAAPDNLPLNFLAILDSAYVKKQPFGVVLILGKFLNNFTNH